jgi:membrane protein YdbS with pleckstrin-like domain
MAINTHSIDMTDSFAAPIEPRTAPQEPPHSVTSHASIADGIDHQLDPRYVTLQRRVGWVGVVFRTAIWGGLTYALLAMAEASPSARLIANIVWAIAGIGFIVLSQWWPGLSYRYASYRVDARGLEIRRGVLWRSQITVPRSRVQHTDVSQGPFERRFGLGTLVVHTAGTSHAMVQLEGLEHGRAILIREHLLPRLEHDVV